MATTNARGEAVPTVIAKEDVEVQDPTTDDPMFKRLIIAGQPVPPDLVKAYEKETGASKAERGPAKDKAQRGPDTSK